MLHDSLYFEVDRRILMLIMLCQWSVLSLLFSYCVTYKKMRSLLFSATVMTFVGMIGIIGLKTYLPLMFKEQVELFLERTKDFLQWSYEYLIGLASKTKAFEDIALMVLLYWLICGILFILSKKEKLKHVITY